MKKRIISVIVMTAMVIGGVTFLARSKVGAGDVEAVNQDKEAEYISMVTDDLPELSLSEQEPGKTEEILENVDSDEIYEVGEDFVISSDEVEQYEEFYRVNGSENAEEEAVEFAEERAALYAEALKNGYEVTDEEVQEYLDELKSTLKETMSETEYRDLVNAVGSEEEYWAYEFELYKVDLPIQKYVADKEAEFKEDSGIEDADELDSEWVDEFEDLKDELVEKQGYREV